jgi:hypothetical protein
VNIPRAPVAIDDATLYPKLPAKAFHPRAMASAMAHVYARYGRLLGDVNLDNARAVLVSTTPRTVAVMYGEQMVAGRPVHLIVRVAPTFYGETFDVVTTVSRHDGSESSTTTTDAGAWQQEDFAACGLRGDAIDETQRMLPLFIDGAVSVRLVFGVRTDATPGFLHATVTHSVTVRKVKISVAVTSSIVSMVTGVTAYDADLISL